MNTKQIDKNEVKGRMQRLVSFFYRWGWEETNKEVWDDLKPLGRICLFPLIMVITWGVMLPCMIIAVPISFVMSAVFGPLLTKLCNSLFN